MAGSNKGGGVKHLLLAHCEKAGAALLIGLAGYLAYASLSAEGTEKSPSDLTSQVGTTNAAYDSSRWSEVPAEYKKLPTPVASAKLDNLPAAPYVKRDGLSRSVVPPTVDRTDPELLAAADLEGTAVTAIFAFESEEERRARLLEEKRKADALRRKQEEAREKGEDLPAQGGYDNPDDTVDEKGRKRRPRSGQGRQEGVATTGYERFKTYSVACVLAKAPVIDQWKLYKQALEEARGYDEGVDVPRYIALYAQRAEVTDDDAEPQWEDVSFGPLAGGRTHTALSENYLIEMISDWIPYPDALVDARYEHPVLTMPLPPLVQQSWGPEVVHSEAPLQVETDAKEAARGREGEVQPELEPGDDSDPFGRRAGGPGMVGARGGEFGGGRPGMRGGRGGRPAGGEFSARGGGYGGEFGGRGGGEYGGAGGSRGGFSARRSAGGEFSIDPDVPFAMVRVWDFGVQPGRQYRYRVKLVLDDVNAEAPRAFLAAEVAARLDELPKGRRAFRATEWSEPSRVISVPMSGDVFVVGAEPASGRNATAEGSVELLVQSYSIDEDRRAIKAGIEEKFTVGAVMNLTEDAEVVSPDGRYIVEMDSFSFNTGLTLVDFVGGEELPGKMKAPARVLLMDAAGRLIVHNELDDRKAVQAHRDTYSESDASGGYGGGYGGEYGGGRGEFSR